MKTQPDQADLNKINWNKVDRDLNRYHKKIEKYPNQLSEKDVIRMDYLLQLKAKREAIKIVNKESK